MLGPAPLDSLDDAISCAKRPCYGVRRAVRVADRSHGHFEQFLIQRMGFLKIFLFSGFRWQDCLSFPFCRGSCARSYGRVSRTPSLARLDARPSNHPSSITLSAGIPSIPVDRGRDDGSSALPHFRTDQYVNHLIRARHSFLSLCLSPRLFSLCAPCTSESNFQTGPVC
jgi:hypothetical protein